MRTYKLTEKEIAKLIVATIQITSGKEDEEENTKSEDKDDKKDKDKDDKKSKDKDDKKSDDKKEDKKSDDKKEEKKDKDDWKVKKDTDAGAWIFSVKGKEVARISLEDEDFDRKEFSEIMDIDIDEVEEKFFDKQVGEALLDKVKKEYKEKEGAPDIDEMVNPEQELENLDEPMSEIPKPEGLSIEDIKNKKPQEQSGDSDTKTPINFTPQNREVTKPDMKKQRPTKRMSTRTNKITPKVNKNKLTVAEKQKIHEVATTLHTAASDMTISEKELEVLKNSYVLPILRSIAKEAIPMESYDENTLSKVKKYDNKAMDNDAKRVKSAPRKDDNKPAGLLPKENVPGYPTGKTPKWPYGKEKTTALKEGQKELLAKKRALLAKKRELEAGKSDITTKSAAILSEAQVEEIRTTVKMEQKAKLAIATEIAKISFEKGLVPSSTDILEELLEETPEKLAMRLEMVRAWNPSNDREPKVAKENIVGLNLVPKNTKTANTGTVKFAPVRSNRR